jgi:hypothetical protein
MLVVCPSKMHALETWSQCGDGEVVEPRGRHRSWQLPSHEWVNAGLVAWGSLPRVK